MKLTIHGQLLPIPDTVAQYARRRLLQALAAQAGRIRAVTLRLVQLNDAAPQYWVAVVDLGAQGAVVTRVRAVDRLAAIDDLAARSADSVANRLALPPRMPAAETGRVVTRVLA